ncbi:MAG: hypothetical protein ABIO70_25520 [Pseudomonadota bacterium]
MGSGSRIVEPSTNPSTLRRSRTEESLFSGGTPFAMPATMLHIVAHAVSGDFLWRSHEEGLALWSRLLALQPAALCLMPDHVHLFAARFEPASFVRVLSGYARWRHHHRGGSGRVWTPHPAPERPSGPLHLRRTWRYIALNPCRDELAGDPLAWVFCTHRDAVGLASPPAVRPARDPERLHHYISADPSVSVEGSGLPQVRADAGRPAWGSLVAAVSALTRTPVVRLSHAGHARQLLVAAARQLGRFSDRFIAERLELSRWTLQREPEVHPEVLDVVTRVLDKPRFAALGPCDLSQTFAWRRYMAEQPRRRSRSGWLFG